ncbi:hypothetical protein JCM33374_g6608 [Metschnikowia sp. JCM 33374]|nr:hypothetical protein JCM33374_g6608 [Metschnikowia sp. JCM 33374]
MCCVWRFTDGLKLLLEFGADWRLADVNGDTCLHLCFAHGDLTSIEALVKYVMAQALSKHREMDCASSAAPMPQKSSVHERQERPGLQERSGVQTPKLDTPDQIRVYLHSILQDYENTPNSRGQYAVSHAASFEMEHAYFTLKKQWVDRVVDDELALRAAPQWDTASSVLELSTDKYPRLPPFASPGASTLAHYANIASASASRTSFDSDMCDGLSPVGEPPNSVASGRLSDHAHAALAAAEPGAVEPGLAAGSAATAASAASAASAGSAGSVPYVDQIHKGRKHSRSLPNSGDSDPVAMPSDPQKPARPHAKSFAFNFRGSPLMTRTSTMSHASQALPISPLQVEFTSTQSRKSSLASSQVRPSSKSDPETPIYPPSPQSQPQSRGNVSSQVLDVSNGQGKTSGVATPTSSSFINQLSFSPVSSSRRKSTSAAMAFSDSSSSFAEPNSQESASKDRSKYPSSSIVRHQSSAESLKRITSTPAKLANVFRNPESPSAALRHNRRPSLGEAPYKLSPAKSIVTQHDANEGSPNDRLTRTSSRLDPPDEVEKKFVFAISRNYRSGSQASLPNLRIKNVHDNSRHSEDDHSLPPPNVRSISFARVREE